MSSRQVNGRGCPHTDGLLQPLNGMQMHLPHGPDERGERRPGVQDVVPERRRLDGGLGAGVPVVYDGHDGGRDEPAGRGRDEMDGMGGNENDRMQEKSKKDAALARTGNEERRNGPSAALENTMYAHIEGNNASAAAASRTMQMQHDRLPTAPDPSAFRRPHSTAPSADSPPFRLLGLCSPRIAPTPPSASSPSAEHRPPLETDGMGWDGMEERIDAALARAVQAGASGGIIPSAALENTVYKRARTSRGGTLRQHRAPMQVHDNTPPTMPASPSDLAPAPKPRPFQTQDEGKDRKKPNSPPNPHIIHPRTRLHCALMRTPRHRVPERACGEARKGEEDEEAFVEGEGGCRSVYYLRMWEERVAQGKGREGSVGQAKGRRGRRGKGCMWVEEGKGRGKERTGKDAPPAANNVYRPASCVSHPGSTQPSAHPTQLTTHPSPAPTPDITGLNPSGAYASKPAVRAVPITPEESPGHKNTAPQSPNGTKCQGEEEEVRAVQGDEAVVVRDEGVVLPCGGEGGVGEELGAGSGEEEGVGRGGVAGGDAREGGEIGERGGERGEEGVHVRAEGVQQLARGGKVKHKVEIKVKAGAAELEIKGGAGEVKVEGGAGGEGEVEGRELVCEDAVEGAEACGEGGDVGEGALEGQDVLYESEVEVGEVGEVGGDVGADCAEHVQGAGGGGVGVKEGEAALEVCEVGQHQEAEGGEGLGGGGGGGQVQCFEGEREGPAWRETERGSAGTGGGGGHPVVVQARRAGPILSGSSHAS
ncbi:hypothetical protein B0H16DRAFT_1456390 [Mycena metata]|uniref:Uncharacterized protein n=1 Tax=Mycena metata TaxID=1033252 RepID=A0AAD7JDN4_9AGAR|nr:hypothetical protein B0H16DRAFT_1456390 [Mycena metata]